MGRIRPSRLIAGLVAVVVIVAGGAVAASADQLTVDGIAPIDHPGQAASVSVCPNQPTDVPILIAARRNGGANVTFANGSKVNVTVQSATTGLTATITDGEIDIPNTWSTAGSNSLTTDTITATVTVNATAAGNGTVVFAFAGNTLNDGPHTGTNSIAVSWTLKPTGCDTTPPTLALPANITTEATGPSGATVTYSATATDTNPLSPTPAVTCTPASGSVFPIATTTVNCSATDAAGNTRAGSFTVKVQDTTAPTVAPVSGITTEATGATTAVSWTTPAANDIVDGARTVTCSPASGTAFTVGSTEVTCSASDTHGNTGTSKFTVTITDTTAPTLVVPADFAAEATSASGAPVTFVTSASDIVDGTLPVTCVPASGSTFALGTTTVNCSATDAAGHTTAKSFKLTVRDTTKPVVTAPANQVLEATGPNGATATFSATATDAVSGSPAATCVPASGSTFAVGQKTVECSATDAAGNTGSASFTVTVQDTTPPAITVPAETVFVEATGPNGATLAVYPVSATDIVDGDVEVTCTPLPGTHTFGFQPEQVTCNAVDAHGNPAVTKAFAVAAVDTTKPVVTAPDDVTEEATSADGAEVTYDNATATDAVTTAVTASCTPSSGSTFPLGNTTVTCTATDNAGNPGSDTFTVTVVDTTGPAITVPDDIEDFEATGPSGAVVTYTGASAVDLVDGDRPVACVPASGSTFALGTTTVTCKAKDTRNNEGTGTFTVSVVDTTAPAISVPDDVTEEATGPSGAVVTYTGASAVDLVDGDRPVACVPASGSTFALGTTTVTCSAEDTRGNDDSQTFTVTVRDTTGPTVTAPDDVEAEATGPTGAVVTYSGESAVDLVDGDRPVDCSAQSGSTFPLGATTVTCTAKDTRNNPGSDTFTVTVKDTTGPAVTAPSNKTAEATSALGAIVNFSASASDIVDGPVAPTCVPASGSIFQLGSTTVTCSATDAHGNAGSASFTVTVRDTTAPSIDVPTSFTRGATGPTGAVVTYTATAQDLVDGAVTAVCTPASGSTFAPGTTTVSCSATDQRGNTAGPVTFTVTVQYSLLGFYQPVDMNGVWNLVKGGSTVPLKFEVFAGTTELTSTSVVSTFTSKTVTCGTTNALTDEIELLTTGGTSLRYDTTGGQFIQNWQTPKKPGECYQVTMSTTGGASLIAFFKLK